MEPADSTSDSTVRPRLPANVKILGLASLLNDIASELAFPLLPLFITTVLGGTKFQLGAIEGVADTTASLTKLLGGSLSDRFRRRRGFIIAGYALAALPIVDLTIEEAPLEEVMRELFGAGDKEARTASRAHG